MAAAIAASEWLRAPSRAAAAAALFLLLLTALLKRRGWLLLPTSLVCVLLGIAQWRIERLERSWGGDHGEREARIQRAQSRFQAELREAFQQADSLARRALTLEALSTEQNFPAAADLIGARGLESGIVVFEASGSPRVWGGRFRLLPSAAGDSVSVQLTAYYAVLEVRRHAASGRTALAAVLLAADPAVPDQERSLATRFRERTEVGLRILAPNAAPDISDVFDYEQPTTSGVWVPFSVQFVPPEQNEALARARAMSREQVAWAMLLTLLGAIWVVPAGLARLVLGLLPIGLALRAPLGTLFGIAEWFDPAVFHSKFLGPISASAGPLALSGIGLILLGALLWERTAVRRLPALVTAVIILLGAPYLVARLGGGIVPPASGVPTRLWLIWQLPLFLAAAGLLTVTVALGRPRDRPQHGWAAALGAAAIALTAAWIGLFTWEPITNWPSWYLLLWLPALLLLLLPADRRATILAIAVLAGSGAGLLAWGAEITGRLRAARADMSSLTESPDPQVEAALHELGSVLHGSPAPRTVPELYRLWHQSPLSVGGSPAVLGVWTGEGKALVELKLDELDLPAELMGELIRKLPATDSLAVMPLQREPGAHHVLLFRRDSGTVVSVALGPPSALVAPSRLGRLFRAQLQRNALYQLSLAPAPSTKPPTSGPIRWRREQHLARGERTLLIAGIPRDIYGTVALGSPSSLAVRGALVLILNLVVLAGLWTLAGMLSGHAPRRPAWMPRLRSYEARLGAALAVFFLAPTVGFAAWGIGRLRGEVRDSRDRMIEQSLRDVVPGSGTLAASRPALDEELRLLGNRVDADFGLYREGAYLAGSTGGLLEALGMLSPFMDPEAYHRIVSHGEVVATSDGPSRAIPLRVGYRAIRLSDLGAGALAMPQSAFDPVLEQRQRDLVMLFLLATLAGVFASLVAARSAARALARPVAELRNAALAFGKGEPIEAPAERPPQEFTPVFSAFEKMTADVRKSREAQERVARIVAWGEMANQVAHEIKNPLTPMRLGVQHLRRVHQDGRTPIGPVLESTTARILAEIDRLDRIARSFSRFGVPASERGPLETVKLPSAVRDVAELYRLGPEGAEIVVEVNDAVPVAARSDEVKEALVNLLENSRNARARVIRIRIAGTTIAVEDDGSGIPAAQLPLIFEPRFSTSTSGSGLGLPIVKRLVESWGGRVEVASQEGQGTVVTLQLQPAGTAGPGPAT
ncbi:MAG TPA: HAMP domain-containing sensor histidine kinase [Gemmatimonadales bacterium]|nr:HAMP domain-containing sensor histidine kinase [Gemmatimonadales bacterium]